MSNFRTLAGLDPYNGFDELPEAAAAKGEKITVYFHSMISIGKLEGFMKDVSGNGTFARVNFYKKNARKHSTTIDSYYNSFWMVVKGWGHPDPDSGWNPAERDPVSGVTTQTGKYMGASSGPQNDFLAGPGRGLKAWAMYKDKNFTADSDVPMVDKNKKNEEQEPTMSKQLSTFKDQIARLAALTETFACQECGKKFKKPPADGECTKCGGSDIDLAESDVEEAVGSAIKTAKVKRLSPKQLDKQISALWGKVGFGVQVDIMDIGKIFKMATDAYGVTGTIDDVEAALKVAITKFQKNAKVQPSGGGPEKRQESVDDDQPDDGGDHVAAATGVRSGITSLATVGNSVVLDIGEPLKYDMDRMHRLMGITSRWPGLGDAPTDAPVVRELGNADPLEGAARSLNHGHLPGQDPDEE